MIFVHIYQSLEKKENSLQYFFVFLICFLILIPNLFQIGASTVFHNLKCIGYFSSCTAKQMYRYFTLLHYKSSLQCPKVNLSGCGGGGTMHA